MTMIDRTLMLTWRLGLLMAAIFTGLLLAHAALQAMIGVPEQILFLGAALVVPMWAMSAALYTFNRLMVPRRFGQRRLS